MAEPGLAGALGTPLGGGEQISEPTSVGTFWRKAIPVYASIIVFTMSVTMGPSTVHYFRWYSWEELRDVFGLDDNQCEMVTEGAQRKRRIVEEEWGEVETPVYRVEYMKIWRMMHVVQERKLEQ